jgi:Ca-activated chloride channel family protein
VLDVSGSMRETDMGGAHPRRIDAAREQALQFAARRTQDRVGLLQFAMFPELRCPPTLDGGALAAFLRGVEPVPPGSEFDRTGIGVALAKAVTLLESSPAKSRVVVLLTDGQNNVPDIEPDAAAKLAKDAAVRVHTIGIGTGTKLQGMFGTRVIPPDFSALERIAQTTGGRFFRAFDGAQLEAVYREIDAMEKVELEDPRYRTQDWFHWPLAAGAAVLLVVLLAELTWMRRLP